MNIHSCIFWSLPNFPYNVWDLICPHRPELSEVLNDEFSDPSKLNGNTWA